MSGDLGTDDLKGSRYDLDFYLTLEGEMKGSRYDLDFYLTLEGEMLYGAVTAGDYPRLSFWVELKKEQNERP